MSSDSISSTPPEIREIAKNTIASLLPQKSEAQYQKQYLSFQEWCKKNKIGGLSENVLLAYFEHQRKKYKPTTMWSIYSMLRSCLSVHKDVDISKYKKLQAFLKRGSQGDAPKKSKILEKDDIKKFITEADDKLYLAMKVILIMGYNGACRREELVNISVDDIEYRPDCIMVSIPKTKNNVPRMFAISDKHWMELITKYKNLRPQNATHKRFFLTYRKGYCINSPIGINTMGQVPKEIAEFLQLPDPQLFTGHCLRRSSATHVANSGGDLFTIKRLGGWKSTAVAEGYVDSSMKQKIDVANMFVQQNDLPGCSSTSNTSYATETSHIIRGNQTENVSTITAGHGIAINSHDTSTVHVHVYNNCTLHK